MIILTEVTEFLEALLKGLLTVIVESSLNICQEFVKFFLILFLLYCMAIWSFQFLDSVVQGEYLPSAITPRLQAEFKSELEEKVEKIKKELLYHKINEEVSSKTQPLNGLKSENPSLIDQLEIEAEFEQYQANLKKSEEEFVKSEIYTMPTEITHISPKISLEDISQMKEELNVTSRPSQTFKTSVGKKSKNKNSLSAKSQEDAPTTSSAAGSRKDSNI